MGQSGIQEYNHGLEVIQSYLPLFFLWVSTYLPACGGGGEEKEPILIPFIYGFKYLWGRTGTYTTCWAHLCLHYLVNKLNKLGFFKVPLLSLALLHSLTFCPPNEKYILIGSQKWYWFNGSRFNGSLNCSQRTQNCSHIQLFVLNTLNWDLQKFAQRFYKQRQKMNSFVWIIYSRWIIHPSLIARMLHKNEALFGDANARTAMCNPQSCAEASS